ncbi:hypothetical protein CFP56_022335 [Quercus suber]|uniref:Uncharacterized protein n=1 Tax=Quercus suber TaxID=58331 RepID=A0AAW0KB28_QUESU
MGAGRPHGARLALHVMITFALSGGATIAITTLLVRNVWGKLYSRKEEGRLLEDVGDKIYVHL